MAVLYLSTFLGVAVTDVSGRPVGKVNDLIARLGGEYPLVFGLRVRTPGRSNLDVSWSDVRAFESSQVFLNDTVDRLEPYELGDRDVLLARHVMDKQIVDLEDRRLIRVQDIELARVGNQRRNPHLFEACLQDFELAPGGDFFPVHDGDLRPLR